MASASTLRRDCLSTIESIAQSVGTVGPSATLGTVIPLLIGKSGGSSVMLFAVIIIIYLFIANTISAFATRYVSAGSLSAYARLGLGRGAGILVGWSYIIAMLFVVASSAVSCAYYLDLNIATLTGSASSAGRSVALTLCVLVGAWWPARKDIRFSTNMMLTAELVSAVLIVSILIVALFRSGLVLDFSQLQISQAKLSEGRMGFVLGFLMLAGFESTTALGEETKGATKSIPRAMLSCLIPVGILYLISVYALRALSQKYNVSLDQSELPFDTLARLIGLPFLGWTSSAGIALSCYTCIIAGLNTGSRVLYSMSQNDELPSALSQTDPKSGNPTLAVNVLAATAALITGVALALGLSLAQGIDYLVQIASLGFLLAYLGVGLAAPIYLWKLHALTPSKLVVTVSAFLAIGCAAILSVYPIAPAPYCYLPIGFALVLLLGSGFSYTQHSKPIAATDHH